MPERLPARAVDAKDAKPPDANALGAVIGTVAGLAARRVSSRQSQGQSQG